MQNHQKWTKTTLLTILSLQTIILAFICMYPTWTITTPLGAPINGILTIIAGIIGFAIGTLTFGQFSTKLLKKEENQKRS